MNALQIYTATAACLLSIAGIASFPYRLSYGNTSWMPRCMRPGSEYLERPYEYRYPAREMDVIFSVLLFFIGFAVLLFMTSSGLPGGIPSYRWLTSLAVLLPGWASCRVFSLRTDCGDGFCHASRLTSFRYWKVGAVIAFTETVFHSLSHRPPGASRLSYCSCGLQPVLFPSAFTRFPCRLPSSWRQ